MEPHFRSSAPYLGHRIVRPDNHALNRALSGGGDLKAVCGLGKRVKPFEALGKVGSDLPVSPRTLWGILLCGLEGGEGGPGSELLVGGCRDLAPSGAAAC